MSKEVCPGCKRNITVVRNPGVSCIDCKKFFHQGCADLDKEVFRSIAEKKLSWTCPTCSKKSTRRCSAIFNPPVAPNKTKQANITSVSHEGRFEAIEATIAELVLKIAQLEIIVSQKSQEVIFLKETLQQVRTQTSHLEQQAIEDNLEVQGVPDLELGDPTAAAIRIGSEINCHLDPSSIHCSVSQSGPKKHLVINFKSKSTRKTFLLAGKQFLRNNRFLTRNETKHKIFVNEQLTLAQKLLLYNVKQFKRTHNFQHAWFRNGQVLLKKDDISPPITVHSIEQLESSHHEASHLLPQRQGDQIENAPSTSGYQNQQPSNHRVDRDLAQTRPL